MEAKYLITNSFQEASITLIPKWDKDITRKGNCRPVFIMNIDAKILSKILAKQVQQCIKSHASWLPVAHTCNPNYLGDWDSEDCGLRPAYENSLRDTPHLQNKQSKDGLQSCLKPQSTCFPSLKPWVQTPKKKKGLYTMINPRYKRLIWY
jgi:hypothetical protein